MAKPIGFPRGWLAPDGVLLPGSAGQGDPIRSSGQRRETVFHRNVLVSRRDWRYGGKPLKIRLINNANFLLLAKRFVLFLDPSVSTDRPR